VWLRVRKKLFFKGKHMSNVNTTAGYYNLPSQAAGNTSANVYLVPASGLFGSGLPSPTLPAGSGLTVSLTPDIATGFSDVHPFKVKCYGKANTSGAASTIIPILYNVPAVAVGQISAAGSVTSTGVVGTGPTLLHTCATIASSAVTTVEFAYEWTLLFNSTAGSLVGFCSTSFTNFTSTPAYTINAVLTGTPIASGLKFADLNFEMTFTFSAATAPNAVQITEFSIDRV
jgi:hypothetical protein